MIVHAVINNKDGIMFQLLIIKSEFYSLSGTQAPLTTY